MSVTIVTATYNKPQFLFDAGLSVLNQSYENWSWWIVLNGSDHYTTAVAKGFARKDARVQVFNEPTDEGRRKKEYMPAVIINKYYPLVNTKYIFWLSDDDTLYQEGLKALVEALEKDPQKDIVYGDCQFVKLVNDQWKKGKWIRAKQEMGLGTGILPDKRIDGGQFLQTKRSWMIFTKEGLTITTDWRHANHIDGIYMNGLASLFTFYPIPVPVVLHRCTPLSTFVQVI